VLLVVLRSSVFFCVVLWPAFALLGPSQQPIRTGTNVVRVDVTVVDRRGNPVTALTAEDFEVREDGQPQTITAFKLVEANGQPTDDLSLPIRSPEHAAAEAARDSVRLFLVFWDEYHIEEFRSARFGREGLTRIMLDAFGPTDLVGIMDPLTPTDAIRFSRDRRALADQVNKLKGRRGVYFPRSLVEEEHLSAPPQYGGIEVIRQQVTTSSIRAAAAFLGTLKEGRKSLILISETLGPTRSSSEAMDVMSDLIRTANDSNTAIYVFDPRGLTVGRARDSEMLETIAYGSGGHPVLTNDIAAGFTQVVKHASAFYLLGYAKEIPQDGKFHEIKVKLKRPGLEVRARSGYWAPRAAEVAASKAAAAAAVLPPAVDAAFAALTPARSPALAEVWTGVTSSGGRSRVTVAWSANARDDANVSAKSVAVTATSGGDVVFTGDVVSGGTSFDAPPGSAELAITIRDASGETIDRITRTVLVPVPSAPPFAVTTPAIVRARNALELRAIGTASDPPLFAGRDFERTDRLLIRFAIQGAAGGTTVNASILDRRGAKLIDLPVEADETRGGYRIDLPLGAIARGEYVIAIDARSGAEHAEAHVAFRIVR
jgi:VWFA-related protein